MEGLDNEVVVDGVGGAVVLRVVQGEAAEGDVADDQVERSVSGAEIGEALPDDGGVGVEGGGDGGCDGLEFDAGDGRGGRGEADEIARAAAGLQDVAGGEAELAGG